MSPRAFSVAFVALLSVFAMVAVSAPVDNDEVLRGANGLVAYVNKKGANIRVHREVNGTSAGNNSNSDNNNNHGFGGKTGAVEVFLDAIEELDANLNKLKGNHRTSSFANVDFDVRAVYNVSLPLARSSDVYADCLNCSATLTKVGEGARISMAVCAISGDGALELDGEVTNVTAGQLKITFTVVGWPWAEDDDHQLAVDIVIKVPPGRNVSKNETDDGGRKPVKFSLGAGSFVDFSRKTYVNDSTWNTMAAGYPKYTSRGANNEFRLILGSFQRSVVYDPIVEVGYEAAVSDPDEDGGSSQGNGLRTSAAASLMFSALLAVLPSFQLGRQ